MKVIQGVNSIQEYRWYVLCQALELEILGMKRHGRSAYSIIKEEFGFKGSKAKVLHQLKEYINERHDRNSISDGSPQGGT